MILVFFLSAKVVFRSQLEKKIPAFLFALHRCCRTFAFPKSKTMQFLFETSPAARKMWNSLSLVLLLHMHCKKCVRLFLFLCLSMSYTHSLMAEPWTAETIPMVHLEDATKYVCNPDGVLSQAAVDSTDLVLQKLEQDKGIQTLVVVVRQLEDGDAYSFGMALGKKYGIGSKEQRTGLIVILATDDRVYQILTGNGLEGTLPDAICRRIQNRVMIPLLKESKWDDAIVSTIRALDEYIRLDESLKPDAKEEGIGTKAIVLFTLGGVIFLVMIFMACYAIMKELKCSRCKKAYYKTIKRQRVKKEGTNEYQVCTLMRCPRCGHEKLYFEDEDNNGDGTALLVGAGLLGGLKAGSSISGTGGFPMGGSFGGGTFGGGGSGGRF